MKEFITIARSYKEDFLETRICPDQHVGKIDVINGFTNNPKSNPQDYDFLQRVNISSFKRRTTNIILVLESPHLSEFVSDNPQPASGNGYGETGRAIRHLFNEVCNTHNILNDGSYDLVILNAVQYQCSLGDIKKYRDNVFIDCWEKFGKSNFIKRMSLIYNPEDYIFNACTAGKNKTKLRDLVQEAINEIDPISHCVIHPSAWMRKHNIAIKNKVSPNFLW